MNDSAVAVHPISLSVKAVALLPFVHLGLANLSGSAKEPQRLTLSSLSFQWQIPAIQSHLLSAEEAFRFPKTPHSAFQCTAVMLRIQPGDHALWSELVCFSELGKRTVTPPHSAIVL